VRPDHDAATARLAGWLEDEPIDPTERVLELLGIVEQVCLDVSRSGSSAR